MAYLHPSQHPLFITIKVNTCCPLSDVWFPSPLKSRQRKGLKENMFALLCIKSNAIILVAWAWKMQACYTNSLQYFLEIPCIPICWGSEKKVRDSYSQCLICLTTFLIAEWLERDFKRVSCSSTHQRQYNFRNRKGEAKDRLSEDYLNKDGWE